MNSIKKALQTVRYPNFWPLLAVIFLALLAGKGLIGEGYFNMHDDLQMMRQLEMEKCFLDGQIPCRWVPDMGYGFGYPLFNFYPPLPYLVGQVFRVAGYSFVDTVKYVFILSFLVSGITMYFLSKEFFGKLGGVLSAAFYIWAPYHSVDIYVRGAMNEAWALMWFPSILYTSYKLTTEKRTEKWVILLALSWFALLTSHNLMVIIFTPFFAIWCLLWILKTRMWKRIIQFIVSGALAFGLASFFTLPVVFEKGAVQTDTLVVGYYEYTAHFASIRQLLFSRFWGYGPSVWLDTEDRMSFQIGWIHWVSSIVALALIGIRILKTRKIDAISIAVISAFGFGWFAAFMAHSRSAPLWGLVGELKFVQFPWRYLTVVIFGFSFLAGAFYKLLPKFFATLVSVILILSVIIYSWNYFVPEYGKLGPLTDEQKFTGAAWELQQTAGIYDYLPNTADTAPKAPQTETAEIVEGDGDIKSSSQGTNWAKFTVASSEDVTVRLNIMDFPGWTLYSGDKKLEHFIPESEDWGRIYVNLPAGEHTIDAKLLNTPVRKWGNILSLVTWLGLIFYLISKRRMLQLSNG